jgi:hypothetical protein
MSRAFVNEDAGGQPLGRFPLPKPDDPGYPLAAARALLRGADEGDSASAEEATGHVWGDPLLTPQVQQILAEARTSDDERLEQLAERYLRAAVRAGGRR